MPDNQPHTVGLFVTCLADLIRPSVAFSTITLLEDAGCRVEVPLEQTCCGQPAYNNGAIDDTRPLARQVIQRFAEYPYVVTPSGSCAGMIKHHYPKLFEEYPQWRARAEDLAARTWEITSFLVEVMDYQPPQLAEEDRERAITYHDSCAGLRELGIKQQPRTLLQRSGANLAEMQSTEVCCGFGGTFCTKMPEISEKMVSDKLEQARATGAELLLGGDLGCLMNISGRASRMGDTLEVRHITELLAGQLDGPAIGEGET
ncbi:MAG: (Fe-S)-binding protein [Halieaceae bacterium]